MASKMCSNIDWLDAQLSELEVQLAERDCIMKKQTEKFKAVIASLVTSDRSTEGGCPTCLKAKLFIMYKCLEASCVAIFALQQHLEVAQNFLYAADMEEQPTCRTSLSKLIIDIERDKALGKGTYSNIHSEDPSTAGDYRLVELCRKKDLELAMLKEKVNCFGQHITDLMVQKTQLTAEIKEHEMLSKNLEIKNKQLKDHVEQLQKSADNTATWRQNFEALKNNCSGLTLLAQQEFGKYEGAAYVIIHRDRHIEELEQKIKKLEKELKDVRVISEEQVEYEDTVKNLENKNKSLQARIKSKTIQVKELRYQIEAEHAAILEIKEKYAYVPPVYKHEQANSKAGLDKTLEYSREMDHQFNYRTIEKKTENLLQRLSKKTQALEESVQEKLPAKPETHRRSATQPPRCTGDSCSVRGSTKCGKTRKLIQIE